MNQQPNESWCLEKNLNDHSTYGPPVIFYTSNTPSGVMTILIITIYLVSNITKYTQK